MGDSENHETLVKLLKNPDNAQSQSKRQCYRLYITHWVAAVLADIFARWTLCSECCDTEPQL